MESSQVSPHHGVKRSEWIIAAKQRDWLAHEGAMHVVTLRGPVLLWGGGAVPEGAFIAACPHRKAPLYAENVHGVRVICRCHGAQFDLYTGNLVDQGMLSYPVSSLCRLDIRLRNSNIEVCYP